ncbi:MAG: hypothetical protein ACJAT2_002495 [Bacteriovoracaceae bacterium]
MASKTRLLAGTVFALTKLVKLEEGHMSGLVVVKFIVLETLPRGCAIVWDLLKEPNLEPGSKSN